MQDSYSLSEIENKRHIYRKVPEQSKKSNGYFQLSDISQDNSKAVSGRAEKVVWDSTHDATRLRAIGEENNLSRETVAEVFVRNKVPCYLFR